MATQIKSKHATVSRQPYELYMGFVDMRNFVQFLPEEKKNAEVRAMIETFNSTVDFVDYHALDQIAEAIK